MMHREPIEIAAISSLFDPLVALGKINGRENQSLRHIEFIKLRSRAALAGESPNEFNSLIFVRCSGVWWF